MFHKGAKVNTRLPPAPARVEIARLALEESEWSRKQEAYRLALANRNKPWARRWLRANGKWN
jgi:hypothetical protein